MRRTVLQKRRSVNELNIIIFICIAYLVVHFFVIKCFCIISKDRGFRYLLSIELHLKHFLFPTNIDFNHIVDVKALT